MRNNDLSFFFFFSLSDAFKRTPPSPSPNATHLSFKCIRLSDCILRIVLLYLNVCREYLMTALPGAF